LQNKNLPININKDLGSFFSLDLNGKGPTVYSKMIVDKLEDKAKKMELLLVLY